MHDLIFQHWELQYYNESSKRWFECLRYDKLQNARDMLEMSKEDPDYYKKRCRIVGVYYNLYEAEEETKEESVYMKSGTHDLVYNKKNEMWVYAGDHGWIDPEDATFVDIEESVQGFDVMTFNYLGEEYKSNIYIGRRPA